VPDFAHPGIAVRRSLCIPARTDDGNLYKLEPMNFHDWYEACVGGRWYNFDAARRHPRGGRVAVAYRRAAADVSIFRQFGPALYPREIPVQAETLDSAPD
jgi:transglutaminase-like putative cysteine protease